MSATSFTKNRSFRAHPHRPQDAAVPSLPLKICIASADFVGPSPADENGLAYTAMAQALAKAGHEVTCLFFGAKDPAPAAWQQWVDKYKYDGLTLIALPAIHASELIAPVNLIRSYSTYQWLKRNDRFDLIHFSEQHGSGYHTLTAKHHGLAFAKATICVGLHGMTSWLNNPQANSAGAMPEVDTQFMERRAVALADAVVSPSHYLIDWISGQQGEMPRRSESPSEIAGTNSSLPYPLTALAPNAVDELVYFGPLDSRKGITLFCDALDCIPSNVAAKIKRVTFMGRESIVDGWPSAKYIDQRAKNWPFPIELKLGYVPHGPVNYLRQPNRLTVIPAVNEISPYRVLECLVAKVGFIASSVGGVAALIDPADAAEVCFEPNTGALCASICAALTQGHRPARPAADTRVHAETWLTAQEDSLVAEEGEQTTKAAIQALSIDPGNIVALKALARIHLNSECHEAALEACLLILKSDPSDAEALQMSREARASSRGEETGFDTRLFSRARFQVFTPDAAEQLA